MLHTAFAVVFYFLHGQTPTRFARLFALSWAVEAVRAAILLAEVRAIGGSVEYWFATADVLCYFANWWLLAGCADLAGVRLPGWMRPAYFWSGIPLVLFNRFLLPVVYPAIVGAEAENVRFHGVLANMVIMFLPVGAARLAVMVWLFRVWRRTRLPGAFIAGGFALPYAVVALAVPFQFYYDASPSWIAVLWCMRVLGFSIGLVMLMLNLQQTAVARSEASLAAAQSLAGIGSWELDVKEGVATWSAEMFRLYGRDPAAGVMSYEEFLAAIHPEDREPFQRSEARAQQQRQSSEHEFRVLRPDGSVRWIHGRNTPFFNAAGDLVRLMGVEQDVTERKRAASRVELQHTVTRVLAEAEPLEPTLRRILEIMARGLDADYGAFWTVDRATQSLRCAELWRAPGERLDEFAAVSRSATFAAGVGLPGRLLAERQPVFITEATWQDSAQFPRRDVAAGAGLKGGTGFPILLRFEIFGVVEFFTREPQQPNAQLLKLFAALGTQIGQFIERQRLEEQYRQSQKMEAVGTLAGGIAHDFNNILTAINGYCELARLDAAQDAAVQGHLKAVQQAARRAADLVRQIMAFSRQKGQHRVPLDVGPVVAEALKLLRATIPTTIDIKVSVAAQLPPVLADGTALHQVIVNLGANASHAMKGRAGRLDIALDAAALDSAFVATHPGLRAGDYVRLTVRDNGTGMNAATLARIFEPFFTTKPPGEGTGLGLAVVHGIVQSHEGAILVESTPGIGTEFRVYLPACAGQVAAEGGEAAAVVPRGKDERILYVDDERPLAEMGKELLERLGYRVEMHDDPHRALESFRARPREFDLVVTDLSMPGMTGVELAQAVLRVRPGMPVVLTSGYTADLTIDRLREHGLSDFLWKPHSLDSLGAAAHRALHPRRA
ncbi:MAG TPA: ATP-binding protein [Opitutus sp.]|nr:ATP-binding protein [Opitutus sp.]